MGVLRSLIPSGNGRDVQSLFPAGMGFAFLAFIIFFDCFLVSFINYFLVYMMPCFLANLLILFMIDTSLIPGVLVPGVLVPGVKKERGRPPAPPKNPNLKTSILMIH